MQQNTRKTQNSGAGAGREKKFLFLKNKCGANAPKVFFRGKILKRLLRVFQLGLIDVSVLAKVVHEALLFLDFLHADFLLLAPFIVLHGGTPYMAVFSYVVKIAVFSLYFFASNFSAHLDTSVLTTKNKKGLFIKLSRKNG